MSKNLPTGVQIVAGSIRGAFIYLNTVVSSTFQDTDPHPLSNYDNIGSNDFDIQSGSGSPFTTPGYGMLTYNGPTLQWLLTLTMVLADGGGQIYKCFSLVTGESVPTTGDQLAQLGAGQYAVGAETKTITSQRIVTLASGNSVTPYLGGTNAYAGGNFTLAGYTTSLVPIAL
jgi:hypothetical protein